MEDGSMREVRLLKVGGSVLTDKSTPMALLYGRLSEVARAVGDAYHSGAGFILGHGAGSFGHVTARHLDLTSPVFHGSKLFAGRVVYEVTLLNQLLTERLLDQGVPVFPFHPSSLILDAEGPEVFFSPVVEAYERGYIPLLHGDVVVSRRSGVTVYSTERVLYLLALHLREQGYSVVLGNAEKHGGVYRGDPDRVEGAELIERITPSTVEEVYGYIGGSSGVDVTGGMRHKVDMLVELARRGVASVIFKGEYDSIKGFLQGRKVRGTYILPG